MTFPVHEVASDVATSNGAGTSHSIVLPATVNAGDRLILIIQSSLPGAAFTYTWDNTTAGTWTQVFNVATADDDRAACFEKIAAGNEDGLTLTITTSGSVASEALAIRVTGAHASAATEAATDATQNSSTHDPPSITPSWGAADTLFIALAMQQGGTREYSAFPTSYTETGYVNNGGNPGACIGYAYRSNNTTSEDPAAFTSSASLRPIVATLAIRPAAAAGNANLMAGKFGGLFVGKL